MDAKRRKEEGLAIVLAFFTTAIFFLTTPITPSNGGYDSDGLVYGVMAGARLLPPDEAAYVRRMAPWCYRIVSPGIASVLPFDPLTNFRVMAFLADFSSLLLLFQILRRLAFSPFLSVVGLLFYAGSFWTLKFSFYSPAYIDDETQFFLLLLIDATLSRRWRLLMFLLPVAALQKESLALYSFFCVAGLHAAGSRGGGGRGALLWRGALLVLLPFGALAVVRGMIEPSNPRYDPTVAFRHLAEVLSPRFWPILLQALFSGLGILPVLLLCGGAWCRFLRRRWAWGVYGVIGVACLFGGGDKARLFLYLLPLVVVLALENVADFERRLPPSRFLPWLLLVVGIHAYMGGTFSAIPSLESFLARWVPRHAKGSELPYLFQNLCLSLLVVGITLKSLAFREAAAPTDRGALQACSVASIGGECERACPSRSRASRTTTDVKRTAYPGSGEHRGEGVEAWNGAKARGSQGGHEGGLSRIDLDFGKPFLEGVLTEEETLPNRIVGVPRKGGDLSARVPPEARGKRPPRSRRP